MRGNIEHGISQEHFYTKAIYQNIYWSHYTIDTTASEILKRNQISNMVNIIKQRVNWSESNNMNINFKETKEIILGTLIKNHISVVLWLTISPPRRETPGSIPTSTKKIHDIYGAIWRKILCLAAICAAGWFSCMVVPEPIVKLACMPGQWVVFRITGTLIVNMFGMSLVI